MARRRSSLDTRRFASRLRHNQTVAELRLWQALRAHRLNGVHFRRQHAIGPYVADFCSPRHKLIIEVDGSHHLEQQAYDAERTAFLECLGYRVLRFWNVEVQTNLEGVLQAIMEQIEAPP